MAVLFFPGFDDAKEDSQLRLHAVQSYLVLLEDEKAVYPQRFLQVMSWVRKTREKAAFVQHRQGLHYNPGGLMLDVAVF